MQKKEFTPKDIPAFQELAVCIGNALAQRWLEQESSRTVAGRADDKKKKPK
jgi:hypothetical protein